MKSYQYVLVLISTLICSPISADTDNSGFYVIVVPQKCECESPEPLAIVECEDEAEAEAPERPSQGSGNPRLSDPFEPPHDGFSQGR